MEMPPALKYFKDMVVGGVNAYRIAQVYDQASVKPAPTAPIETGQYTTNNTPKSLVGTELALPDSSGHEPGGEAYLPVLDVSVLTNSLEEKPPDNITEIHVRSVNGIANSFLNRVKEEGLPFLAGGASMTTCDIVDTSKTGAAVMVNCHRFHSILDMQWGERLFLPSDDIESRRIRVVMDKSPWTRSYNKENLQMVDLAKRLGVMAWRVSHILADETLFNGLVRYSTGRGKRSNVDFEGNTRTVFCDEQLVSDYVRALQKCDEPPTVPIIRRETAVIALHPPAQHSTIYYVEAIEDDELPGATT